MSELLEASMYEKECRWFSGYRPCRFRRPCPACPHFERQGEEILLICLEGLGDVVRTTALVPALRRAYPNARLSWLTRGNALPLLAHIPGIDRTFGVGLETLEILRATEFDLVLNPDKSALATSLTMAFKAGTRRGFGVGPRGVVVPLNAEAEPLYHLGLNDRFKFLENRDTLIALTGEALGLPFQAERAQFRLTSEETERARVLREQLLSGGASRRFLIGFNTGCADRYPLKKTTLNEQVALIHDLLEAFPDGHVLLLGGPEEEERNAAIAARVEPARLFASPLNGGIREGGIWLAACDLVVTGDTLALHLALALERYVVAWFGLTCHQEIDLGGRGLAVLSSVGCRPCWRQNCDNVPRCDGQVSRRLILEGVEEMVSAMRRGEPWRGASPRWELPVGGFWEDL